MDNKLSEAEQVYIIHGIQQDLRNDGRSCEEFRLLNMEVGLVGNSSGSSRVCLGNSDVLIGVKAEIEAPSSDSVDCGRINFFVDCSANATPEFEGRGGEDIAHDIESALSLMFQNDLVFDLKSLCILPQHFCWVLYVDVVLLECGGNLYDAVASAVKAALFDVRLPNVTIAYNEKNEPDLEMTDDFYNSWRLDISHVPLMVTVHKIGTGNVVDCTWQEEKCSLSSLLVGVTAAGLITLVRQEGRGSLDPDSLTEMLDMGVRVGKALNKVVNDRLAVLKVAQVPPKGFLA